MKNPTSPVTAENLEQFYDAVHACNVKNDTLKAIRPIVLWVGGILFLLSLLFFAFGAVVSIATPESLASLSVAYAPLMEAWAAVMAFARSVCSQDIVVWLLLGVCVFAIPTLLSYLLVAILLLTRRPAVIPPHADELDEMAKETYHTAKHSAVMILEMRIINHVVRRRILRGGFTAVLGAFLLHAVILYDRFGELWCGLLLCLVLCYFASGPLLLLFQRLSLLFPKVSFFSLNHTKELQAFWHQSQPEDKRLRRENAKEQFDELLKEHLNNNRPYPLFDFSHEEHPEYFLMNGFQLESDGYISSAKYFFHTAAKGGVARAMFHYARCCLLDGERSEAVEWLEKYIAADDGNAEWLPALQAIKNGEDITLPFI